MEMKHVQQIVTLVAVEVVVAVAIPVIVVVQACKVVPVQMSYGPCILTNQRNRMVLKPGVS